MVLSFPFWITPGVPQGKILVRSTLSHIANVSLAHGSVKKYMLFAGWEVRTVKNCDRGLENAARGRRPRAAFSSPR